MLVARAAAVAFVYTIDTNNQALRNLENLLVQIKTFLHPSNIGEYAISLGAFVIFIAREFLKRQHKGSPSI